MNTSYTPAQFVKGLREARNEERQRIIDHATKRLSECAREGDTIGSGVLMALILDLKENEHGR